MLDLIHSAAFKEFGHALALFAVVFHGSSGLYTKGNIHSSTFSSDVHPFAAGQGHPIEVQFYFCLGIFGSCACAALHNGLALSGLGLLSGFLAIAYHTLSFASAQLIGLSMSSAVVSCVAMIGAFSVGYLLLDNAVWSSSMCSVALTMMMLGNIGVCWCNEITWYLKFAEERSPILQPFQLETAWRRASPISKGTGLLLALVGGVSGAMILVPWQLYDSMDNPPAITMFIESFGIGAVATGTVLAAGYFACFSKEKPTVPTRYSCCAILSGIIWNVSNIFAMFAIRHLGYSAAYPAFHCQMAVVVFWNIYLVKEGRGSVVFMLSVLILAAGVVLLSMIAHV